MWEKRTTNNEGERLKDPEKREKNPAKKKWRNRGVTGLHGSMWLERIT